MSGTQGWTEHSVAVRTISRDRIIHVRPPLPLSGSRMRNSRHCKHNSQTQKVQNILCVTIVLDTSQFFLDGVEGLKICGSVSDSDSRPQYGPFLPLSFRHYNDPILRLRLSMGVLEI